MHLKVYREPFSRNPSSLEQTLTFKSVTDRLLKTQRFFAASAAGEIRAPPKYREPQARSCSFKTFGVWRIVSPLGGTENLGVTRPVKFFKLWRSRGHRRDIVILDLIITAVASGIVEGERGTRGGRTVPPNIFIGNALPQMMSGQGGTVIH